MNRHAIAMVLAAAALVGCATLDYQPYEGAVVPAGQGASKTTIDGIDFFSNGRPTRAYRIIGIAEGAIGAGVGADNMIRSRVADEVKKRGGDAAVEISGNTAMTGFTQIGASMMATGTRTMKFAIIKFQ